jgi:hypothetical protein
VSEVGQPLIRPCSKGAAEASGQHTRKKCNIKAKISNRPKKRDSIASVKLGLASRPSKVGKRKLG